MQFSEVLFEVEALVDYVGMNTAELSYSKGDRISVRGIYNIVNCYL